MSYRTFKISKPCPQINNLKESGPKSNFFFNNLVNLSNVCRFSIVTFLMKRCVFYNNCAGR